MMNLILRLGVVLALGGLTALIIALGRAFVAGQHRRARAAAPLASVGTGPASAVRILAFSSADCRQCHTHQTPALRRVLAARPGQLSVEEIDAPATPDLAARYHILTVPATVVLDAAGRARAVNFGFAPTARLLEQVDAVLNETMAA
jgi:hypothetical protein